MLRLRRNKTETQKERFFQGMPACHGNPHCDGQCPQQVNANIVSSWQRSPAILLHQQAGATRDDDYTARYNWEASPLRQAASSLSK
jgi:hypothetical protein